MHAGVMPHGVKLGWFACTVPTWNMEWEVGVGRKMEGGGGRNGSCLGGGLDLFCLCWQIQDMS